jgi:hypothetical protein
MWVATRSFTTSTGRPLTLRLSSNTIVVRPDTTTKTWSASMSVKTPGVCCQTPHNTKPSGRAPELS